MATELKPATFTDWPNSATTDGGVIERVFWEVETGQEVAGPDWHGLMERLVGPEREAWKTWAEKTAFGYRLPPPEPDEADQTIGDVP